MAASILKVTVGGPYDYRQKAAYLKAKELSEQGWCLFMEEYPDAPSNWYLTHLDEDRRDWEYTDDKEVLEQLGLARSTGDNGLSYEAMIEEITELLRKGVNLAAGGSTEEGLERDITDVLEYLYVLSVPFRYNGNLQLTEAWNDLYDPAAAELQSPVPSFAIEVEGMEL